jgi:hypothetical protein
MRRVRKAFAGAALTFVVAGGFGVAGIGTAVAATGAHSTLDCAPGGPSGTLQCTATAPDGVHRVTIKDLTTGRTFVAGSAVPCSSATPLQSLTFGLQASDKYKAIVADCSKPNDTDTYKVASDGTVTLIHSSGTLTS